jgi:hypothetical protein
VGCCFFAGIDVAVIISNLYSSHTTD